MTETPKIEHETPKDITVASENKKDETMEPNETKTMQTPAEESKYTRLKQRFAALKKEYLLLLQNWEESNQRVTQLSQERKFLREKL